MARPSRPPLADKATIVTVALALRPHDLRSPFEKWLHVLRFAQAHEEGDLPVPQELQEEEANGAYLAPADSL